MIRNANQIDIPRIIEMGHQFIVTSEYLCHVGENHEQISALALKLITDDNGALLVATDRGDRVVGMIGMLAFSHHISGELIAGEIIWWVEPEHRGLGLKLFRAAEKWAIGHGVKRIQMIAPNDGVGKIYARMGYTPIEVAYQRDVA